MTYTKSTAPISGIVYVLYDGSTERCKIGCSSKIDGTRQKQVNGSYSFPLLRLADFHVSDIKNQEKLAHVHFKAFRSNGEWFKVKIEDLLTYFVNEVNWSRMDIVSPTLLLNYTAAIRFKNDTTIQKCAKASFTPVSAKHRIVNHDFTITNGQRYF